MPRTAQVLAVSRQTFNKDYAGGGLQITSDLPRDTPYDLATYPKKADVPTTTRTSMVDIGNGLKMASTVVPFGRSGPYNTSGDGGAPSWRSSVPGASGGRRRRGGQ